MIREHHARILSRSRREVSRACQRRPRWEWTIYGRNAVSPRNVRIEHQPTAQRGAELGNVVQFSRHRRAIAAQCQGQRLVQAQADLAGAMREQATKSRSMQEVAAWLASKDTKFTENRGVRAAEYLSINFLSTLQAMKPGEMRVIESGGRVHVFRLQASQAAPVDQPSAAPRIRQFLFNQKLAQALDVDVAELRKRSKIEYVGEFAKPAADAAEATPAAGAKAPEPSAPNVQKAVRALR